jgi:hypothetical protein
VRKVPSSQPLAPEQAKSLVRLFNRIEARVSEIIEEGIAERLYFLRVKVPRISNEATGIVRRVRQRYVPITSQVRTDLLRLARDELRPAPLQPTPPPGAASRPFPMSCPTAERPSRTIGEGVREGLRRLRLRLLKAPIVSQNPLRVLEVRPAPPR